MTEPRQALLAKLADGSFHSGEALGAALGCSRAAVWKQVRHLQAMGLGVESRRSRGYRLEQPIELLSVSEMSRHVPPATRSTPLRLEVLFTVDSTNDYLLRAPATGAGVLTACAAEFQTGGRGRRGRRWLSPPGEGLCLSVGWTYDLIPQDFPALGLAVGVAVAESLLALGAAGIGLKWPNDLVCPRGKVGGILLDVVGESAGPLRVVVGVGINLRASTRLRLELASTPAALPVASLEDVWAATLPSRNLIAGTLIGAIHRTLSQFQTSGFAPFRHRFADLDRLSGQLVTATVPGGEVTGQARGVGADGALLIEDRGTLRPVVAGEVSVRAAP